MKKNFLQFIVFTESNEFIDFIIIDKSTKTTIKIVCNIIVGELYLSTQNAAPVTAIGEFFFKIKGIEIM